MRTSDSELVQRCIQGDNSAFDALVRRYQQQVYGLCCRMLGDCETAGDVTQESFLKAYKALRTYRNSSSFLSWIFRIANNTCIDLLRKKARMSESNIDDCERLAGSVPSPEKSTMENETNRTIQAALMYLPEKYRSVMVMFHFSGMGIRDISEALGKPEGTVKSDLHHGRELLRRRLEGVVTA